MGRLMVESLDNGLASLQYLHRILSVERIRGPPVWLTVPDDGFKATTAIKVFVYSVRITS